MFLFDKNIFKACNYCCRISSVKRVVTMVDLRVLEDEGK